jgi:hypothetical protein
LTERRSIFAGSVRSSGSVACVTDNFGKGIAKRKSGVRERHVQRILLGEEEKLVRFDGIRRDRLKPPIAMKHCSKNDAIHGIRELDSSISKRDMHGVTNDAHILGPCKLGRIH